MAFFDPEQFKTQFNQQRPGLRQGLRDQGFSGQDLRDRLQGFRRAARTGARVAGRQQQNGRTPNFGSAFDRGVDKTTNRGQQIKSFGLGSDSSQDQRQAAFGGDFRSMLMQMLQRMFGGQ